MGFLDAFVYAHHQHRRGIENPGNLVIASEAGFTRTWQHALQDTCRHSRAKTSVCRSPKPVFRIFPMLVPQHMKEAMITVDGLFIQMEVLASRMVKLLLDGV